MISDVDAGTRHVLRCLREWSENGKVPTPASARADLERLTAFAAPAAAQVESWDESIAGPGGPLTLRIHRPLSCDASGAVLYVHGGGWVTGSVEVVHSVCQQLAEASRVVVAAVGYRLSPESPYPAALDDVDVALDWVRQQNPGARIALIGESAGGTVASGASLRRRDRGLIAADFLGLIYPALDPAMNTASHGRYGKGYALESELMEWYWRQYLGDERDAEVYAVPSRAESLAGLPRTLILTAGLDPLLDEGRAFADRLQADGTPTTVLHYPRAIHGFIFCSGAIPQGLAALRELGVLVSLALRPDA